MGLPSCGGGGGDFCDARMGLGVGDRLARLLARRD